jgi:hypothetical protein
MATLIKLDERVSSPRGRKADLDPKLVALLTADKLPVDAAIVLGEKEGVKATDKPGPERSAIQNRIRSHWKAAGRTEPVSIRFRPTTADVAPGMPQVSVNATKLAKQAEASKS